MGSETPTYIGRAVVALASDPRVLERSGQALSTWQPARLGSYFRANVAA